MKMNWSWIRENSIVCALAYLSGKCVAWSSKILRRQYYSLPINGLQVSEWTIRHRERGYHTSISTNARQKCLTHASRGVGVSLVPLRRWKVNAKSMPLISNADAYVETVVKHWIYQCLLPTVTSAPAHKALSLSLKTLAENWHDPIILNLWPPPN